MRTLHARHHSRFSVSAALLAVALCTLTIAQPLPARGQAGKAAAGEMRWALHVTLAARWLDPAETEALSTPFMVMYALHDAMVKPMPGGLMPPSLADSRPEAKAHPSYTFQLRKGARVHT